MRPVAHISLHKHTVHVLHIGIVRCVQVFLDRDQRLDAHAHKIPPPSPSSGSTPLQYLYPGGAMHTRRQFIGGVAGAAAWAAVPGKDEISLAAWSINRS